MCGKKSRSVDGKNGGEISGGINKKKIVKKYWEENK